MDTKKKKTMMMIIIIIIIVVGVWTMVHRQWRGGRWLWCFERVPGTHGPRSRFIWHTWRRSAVLISHRWRLTRKNHNTCMCVCAYKRLYIHTYLCMFNPIYDEASRICVVICEIHLYVCLLARCRHCCRALSADSWLTLIHFYRV